MNQQSLQHDGMRLATGTQVDPRKESRSRWFWICVILTFFALQALLWTSAISLVQKYPMRSSIESDKSKLDARSSDLDAKQPSSVAKAIGEGVN